MKKVKILSQMMVVRQYFPNYFPLHALQLMLILTFTLCCAIQMSWMEFRIISPQATLGNGWFKPWGGGGFPLGSCCVVLIFRVSLIKLLWDISQGIFTSRAHFSIFAWTQDIKYSCESGIIWKASEKKLWTFSPVKDFLLYWWYSGTDPLVGIGKYNRISRAALWKEKAKADFP